jgi:hypothetical protein
MTDEITPYPGALASPRQLYDLAEEYRKAAHFLLQLSRSGKPLTRAPFRMSAIHAIELYLNALLLQRGHSPQKIRGLQHDLGARADILVTLGLDLRVRTSKHLHALSRNREHLITRYAPELSTTSSEINRLTATLEEIATKTAKMLSQSAKTTVTRYSNVSTPKLS